MFSDKAFNHPRDVTLQHVPESAYWGGQCFFHCPSPSWRSRFREHPELAARRPWRNRFRERPELAARHPPEFYNLADTLCPEIHL